MDKKTTAQYIDHTLLSASATRDDVDMLCKEAMRNGFKAVCVNSYWVPFAVKQLEKSDVMVATVVGFPLGASSTETKVCEAVTAVRQGADEIDVVMNVGLAKSGEWGEVHKDLTAVVDAAKNVDNRHAVVKVIIETGLLNDKEKVMATKMVLASGADFVKTCTGFNEGSATVKDVQMMKTLGAELVKASGGVRTLDSLKSMVDAGADRIGTSNGVAILAEFDNVENKQETQY